MNTKTSRRDDRGIAAYINERVAAMSDDDLRALAQGTRPSNGLRLAARVHLAFRDEARSTSVPLDTAS